MLDITTTAVVTKSYLREKLEKGKEEGEREESESESDDSTSETEEMGCECSS